MAIVIHPTARVEADISNVEDLYVGPFSFVSQTATLSARCRIGAHAFVGARAVLSPGAIVGNYSEVRDDCSVGVETSIGSRVTLSAGTLVGDHCVIKYGFVATDTPDLANNEKKLTCNIGHGVLIGANVTLLPGLSVGDGAVIGACSQVRHSVGPHEVWFGNPARRMND